MGIIRENFMLYNKTGLRLYQEYAEKKPIIDYHCHLPVKDIADDHTFSDAYELFLGGDHYKWRQMRSNGIAEEYITGNADPYEKWCAFASTLPLLIGNPIYHWTSLELKRYFDIDEPLCASSAKEIWDTCNKKLATPEFSAKNLILSSNVETLCTTDDPADDLKWHKAIRDTGFATGVLPTFRPDKAIGIDKDGFLEYISGCGITTYSEMCTFLKARIAYFHENGCRLADHSLEYVPYAVGNAEAVFEKAVNGGKPTAEECEVYKTALLTLCTEEYTARGWAMQIHIGAMRNNNTRMFEKLGPDTGFDSILDLAIAEKLSRLLDSFERNDSLPKTILYTLNPKDNYVLGTMLGNFQKAPIPGKIQFGSGWWFNDHRDGMEAQMKSLANLGILGNFVGMLTDSRSFVSYPRHEYFRRIFCNLVGTWVENGEYPDDRSALERIITGVCYGNAKRYFAF